MTSLLQNEQTSFDYKLKIVKRIKSNRLFAIILLLVSFPVYLLIVNLGIEERWILAWLVPVSIYILFVGISRCPQCGKFFFYRNYFAGFFFWFVNECQSCKFPRQLS
jgi:hypothetical protein